MYDLCIFLEIFNIFFLLVFILLILLEYLEINVVFLDIK